jgi:cyclic pyranopterin phosphate synthase
MKLTDKYNRIHKYLRISITDKCNLNCIYCKPTIVKSEINRLNILSFEEIERLVNIFVYKFEFDKVRITGGEPFVRKDVSRLIDRLVLIKSYKDFELTATTNGTLIKNKIFDLKKSGLDRLNFSLDTLKREKFNKISGYDKLSEVIDSIDQARNAGFENIKINSVIIRGINDDEILDLVLFAMHRNITIRFIEYMPFSDNFYQDKVFISSNEILEIIKTKLNVTPINHSNGEIADYYKVENFECQVGLISSISNHFCSKCNRVRITSEGKIKPCLFSSVKEEVNLANYMRDGVDDNKLIEIIEKALKIKKFKHPDLLSLKELKNNKMFKIGG